MAAGLSKAQTAGVAPDPKLRRLLKLDEANYAAMLEALGYRKVAPKAEGEGVRWRAPNAPRAAKTDAAVALPPGPFSNLADLLPPQGRK